MRRAGQDSVVRMVEEVEGRRPVGRPRKTWSKCIEQDLNQLLGLREEMAQDRREWRRVINRPTIMAKGGRQMKKKNIYI